MLASKSLTGTITWFSLFKEGKSHASKMWLIYPFAANIVHRNLSVKEEESYFNLF